MTRRTTACDQAKATIQRSLDGLLPPEERSALAAHLESCTDCRREQDALRRLARLADRWASQVVEASDLGDEWTAQVLFRLKTPPASARLRAWLPLTAAALLLAVLTVVPGIPYLGLGAAAQTVAGLPRWLQANLAALPGDSHAVLRTSLLAASLPAWTVMLLLGMIGLNVGFCVHARQRSVS